MALKRTKSAVRGPARTKLYANYLASPVWAARRAAAIARDGKCRVPGCDSTDRLQVHHVRYPHPTCYGREPLAWLVTLCSKHHWALHRLAENERIGIGKATRIILAEIQDTRLEVRDGRVFAVTVYRDGERRNKQRPFLRNHSAHKGTVARKRKRRRGQPK